jgi:hypothetical protein
MSIRTGCLRGLGPRTGGRNGGAGAGAGIIGASAEDADQALAVVPVGAHLHRKPEGRVTTPAHL